MGGSRLAFRAWKELRFYKRFLNAREPIFVLGADHGGGQPRQGTCGQHAVARGGSLRRRRRQDGPPAARGQRPRPPAGYRVVERAARRHAGDHRDAGSRRTRSAAARWSNARRRGCEVLTVPSYDDLVSGRVTVSQMRHVELDDLLGRDPVTLDTGGLREWLSGRVVMVTGAGGSIGSELARQIARFTPRRLVLLELNEYNLYTIEQEFAEQHPGAGCRVRDRRRQGPGARGGGAAPLAAVRRVSRRGLQARAADGGRERVAGGAQQRARHRGPGRAAALAGVEKFVFISTDKAVNPTSVMGASKRLAEMVCQALQQPDGTRFVMVRFGNVLGSAGSVIPKFREQIAAGGPVTVTHPEISALLHVHPRGRAARAAGGVDGHGRRDLRAGHGRAGQDRGPRARPDPALGIRRGRHQDRVHRAAAGREALRGAACRRTRNACPRRTPSCA